MSWLRELAYIHKSDRRVLLTLLTVAIVALLIVTLTGKMPQQPMADAADSLRLQSLQSGQALRQGRTSANYVDRQQPAIVYRQSDERHAELFDFDPNTADITDLLRLGLQPWQVKNIYKYRAHGGIYRKKSDFARLYGLTAKQYRELEPYIHISADYLPATTLLNDNEATAEEQQEQPQLSTSRHKLAAGETIDLNSADTTALMTVPGIGSYFARRIADYRQRLGGYVNLAQLDEISDFPAEAKAFFTITQPQPRRLNINRLTLNELKRHPYINYYQARAIVDYRRTQGAIGDIADLHLLPDFPPEAIERLRPYLSY